MADWFREVEQTAIGAGLLWVVAMQMDSDDLIGSPEWIGVVRSLPEQCSIVEGTFDLRHTPLNPSVGETHHIVELRLPGTDARIWFGVGRKGFGPELELPSPWRMFLERFAEIADSALVRFTAAMEFQRLQVEAAEAHRLATVAVTTGFLHHQLANLAKDLSSSVSELNEALKMSGSEAEGEIERISILIKESADDLLRLATQMKNITKMGDRPCRLSEVVEHSKRLFANVWAQQQIALETEVQTGLEIDVPLYVAALAIANLVENAKDALMSGSARDLIGNCRRIIRIEAQDMGDVIHCRVTDNGPGIKRGVRDRIFDIGFTTKPNSGGWGLYLVRRSLQENGAIIELTSPGPGDTTFTIYFPKSKQEKCYEQ
jgi:signal transduction histidine kinase